MKGSFWKLLLKVAAAGLLCVVLFFANAFFGNPLSAALARVAADRYVAQEYGHLDVKIEKVGYDFKSGNYYAHVSSPTSRDTYFTVYISMLGKVERDTYDSVTDGFNTWGRLNEEYRVLVKETVSGWDWLYEEDILTGDLMGSGYDCGWIEDYELSRSELVLDGEYDILELGARHGGIYISVHDEDVSYKRGAEILSDIAARLEDAGIPFFAVDFKLSRPKVEGQPYEDVTLWLLDFPAADIGGADFEQKVREGHERTMAYFEEENRLKLEEEKLLK